MSDSGDLPLPDETTPMPATDGPVGAPTSDAPEPGPWSSQRSAQVAMILGALALLGLGALALYQVLDDDVEQTPVAILQFVRVDQEGEPLSREVEAEVTGVSDAANEFFWLLPPSSDAPLPAVTVTSNSSGRANFEWGPTPEVTERETWTSTIVLRETFTAEESLLDTEIECVLQRPDESDRNVLLVVTFDSPPDLRADRTAIYAFPGHLFLVGDVVRCVVPNGPSVGTVESTDPPATTLPGDPTTTLETTTTIADATTTTTPGATTTSPTTVPGATTTAPEETTTTAPATSTVLDVIQSRSDLSRLSELVALADLEADLSNPALTLTLFAPNNDAFAAAESAPDAPDYTDPATVRNILLTHLHGTGTLLADDVLALSEITVAFAGPHDIDAAATPPTVGDAAIIEPDLIAGNGVLHILSSVIDLPA
ncbi:MAG: fasciclin domain-containing protein [Ilumatobacteraceae bacterium]